SDSAERTLPFLVWALNRCRILKAPVDLPGSAGEYRAFFFSGIANGDDVPKLLSNKFSYGLGPMMRDIDSQFTHHRDGFRAKRCRMSSSRENLKTIAGFMAQQSFRHLASGRVSCAENQNLLFIVLHRSRLLRMRNHNG